MKVSDYVSRFLHEQGVEVVFEMIGGMITHLIDSIYQDGQIRIVSMHHEQGAAFAAEGIGRMTGVPGVALATSGPGATNLVTAVGSCYFDSVPAVFITGQVNTTELSGDRPVRQQGFQETDIVSIVKPITKGAWMVSDVADVEKVFQKAFRTALEGRPGPVLIDLPMDVQRMDVEHPSFKVEMVPMSEPDNLQVFIEEMQSALAVAERPLVLAGGGIRSAGATDVFHAWVEAHGLPVIQSLMGLDCLPYDHPQRVGMLGTYGNRWANQALMESDCLLVFGSRLDVRQTGADTDGFRGNRKIFHIDCDPAQLNNRITGCRTCEVHLSRFFSVAQKSLIRDRDWSGWLSRIKGLQAVSSDVTELGECVGINPNQFIHTLSQASGRAVAWVADVGKNQMWVGQSVELAMGQRMLMSGGMGSMGFALPSAIGAATVKDAPVVAVAGDGGFQCNIQELEVIAHHGLPIKIVVFNNKSLGMVRQFQEEYFDSREQSTVWGYSAPDFEAVAKAYGLPARTLTEQDDIQGALEWLWENPYEPSVLTVNIDINTKVLPKVSFGRPINDMDPRRN